VSKADLARYLRQLGELGGTELYLDRLTAAEVRAAGRSETSRTTKQPATPAKKPSARRPADAPAVARPRAAADSGPLDELGQVAAGCTLCRLHESRNRVVFGEGNPAAELVIVGEAPGQEEDRTGRPFVGRAGKLLDLLLMAAGFPRASVYICNVLKCRPPQNRNPLADEVDACTTNYLHRQLELIAPRVLFAVGRFAAQALAGSDDAIGRLRGRVHVYRGTPLVVSYHPAYLLRSPNMMREAWRDLQLMRTVLDEQA
jgi:DNA polymerase